LDVPLRLARARLVAQAHGGEVFAERTSGGRLRLGLRLPIDR
jgi:hypothetical protein